MKQDNTVDTVNFWRDLLDLWTSLRSSVMCTRITCWYCEQNCTLEYFTGRNGSMTPVLLYVRHLQEKVAHSITYFSRALGLVTCNGPTVVSVMKQSCFLLLLEILFSVSCHSTGSETSNPWVNRTDLCEKKANGGNTSWKSFLGCAQACTVMGCYIMSMWWFPVLRWRHVGGLFAWGYVKIHG